MSRFLLVLAQLTVFTVFGCATKNIPVETEEPYFSISELKSIASQAPLPNKYDVFITWHYPDNRNVSQLGFEAWDIDRDGRFDMVYSLNSDRRKIAVSYDFNGDSIPDRTVRIESPDSTVSVESEKIVSQDAIKTLLQFGH